MATYSSVLSYHMLLRFGQELKAEVWFWFEIALKMDGEILVKILKLEFAYHKG